MAEMIMDGIIALNQAKKYTAESLNGLGALKGANCVIESIDTVPEGNRVTFSWTGTDGTIETSTMIVENGIDGNDGTNGADGVGISKIEKINTVGLVDTYRITFTDNTTYDYSVTNGQKGEQGIQGLRGEKGEQGEQGVQGVQGIQGEKGDDGYPFLIYKEYSDISEFNKNDFPEIGLMFMIKADDATSFPVYRYTGDESTLYSYVTNLTGGEGIKGEKGDKGEQGQQGVQGENGKDGITYIPTIGTVTSGDIASATVVVDDKTSTAEFSFVLPKGDNVTVDAILSNTSENPVQNKVVKQAIDSKADKSKYGDTTINVGRKSGTTVGKYSTAEGNNTTSSGWTSHAEGDGTTASGTASHAEGQSTTASGNNSHAEGNNTTASGNCSHAEGYSSDKVTQLITDFLNGNITKDDIINTWNTKKFSVAHGNESHVEGQDNLSLGHYSHTEGLYTVAIGNQSHTSGYYTKALHDNEAAYGKYNESNDNTLFSVGDGTADDARHNAFEITTTGGKLHDKDIATTDLIPTTLPANGGNAATVGGVGIANLRQITQTVINTLPAVPNGEADFLVNCDTSDTSFPYRYGHLSIRYGSYTGEYVAIFRTTGNDNKVYYNTYLTDHWSGWINVADGGNADTVDGKHAGDFATSANPTITGIIKIVGSSTNTVQAIFSDGDIIRIRNLDSETSQTNNYADIVVTTSGIFTETAVNGVWQGRKELLTSTCVTGTSTIIDSNNFVSVNFGFTPSAVLYAVYDSKTGVDNNYRLAQGFNSTGFIAHTRVAPVVGGTETFSYIAFR